MSPSGQLNNGGVRRTLLQLHNPPDRDTSLSHSFMLMGRQLKDFLPSKPGHSAVFTTHKDMSSIWQKIENYREMALA